MKFCWIYALLVVVNCILLSDKTRPSRYVSGTLFCQTKRDLLRSVTSTWPVDRYVAQPQKTLTVNHLSCQPEPATAIRLNEHPTTARGDGERQRAFHPCMVGCHAALNQFPVTRDRPKQRRKRTNPKTMTTDANQKLFSYLDQDFNISLLESEMSEIEHIVCADDLRLLTLARIEIEALHNRTGYRTSNILQQIERRLDEFPPITDLSPEPAKN